jgi:hypothetical protein
MNRLPLVPALILAAALAAGGAARAADPEAMATAPAATSGAPPTAPAATAPSVADQIDSYLKTSPAVTLPKDGANGVTSGEEPRKVHGVVDVAVGSNGYRSAFVQSDIPVGKTGTLSIAVGETRFNGRVGYGGYGGGYGGAYGGLVPGQRQSLALGLRLGEAALDPRDLRCRQAGEDGPDLRDDQRFEGARPRPCRTAEAPTSPQ